MTIFDIHFLLSKLTTQKKLYVAYSGGVDSHVLLHLLVSLRNNFPNKKFEIIAIHIDHGLHPQSQKWALHCKTTCQKLQVPCIISSFKVREHVCKKESLETAARRIRYDEFKRIIQSDSALFTAHHADDQAETLLLQLLRGSGVKGLAAIAAKSKLGEIELLRPLLSFSHAEILQYASFHRLSWVEDVSNQDTNFSRNYLRHEIIPLLKEKWSGLLKTLGRTIQNCTEANHLLEILAAQDFIQVQGSIDKTLSINKLLDIDSERQRNVIRYWLILQKLPLPSREKLLEIQKTVLNSANDKLACVAWKGVEVRRYQNNIYAMPPLKQPKYNTILTWNLSSPLVLPCELGILKADFVRIDNEQDNKQSNPNYKHDNITVRFRNQGEKCKLKGRKTHLLKKLFQEWGVPYWQRSRIPLIYQDNILAAVVGYCICETWDERIKIWQE